MDITGSTDQPGQTLRVDVSLSARGKAFAMAGVLMGLFLAALDQTIVAAALPKVIADLKGIELFAWTSTAYLLASTTTVPIYGKLSDNFGRKRILLWGIVLFLLGSVLCGLSRSMFELVLFRGLQGLGAAAISSTAFAVPADLYPPAERGRVQGLFIAILAVSSVLGPILGGLLTDGIGWRWIFFINLPLGAIAIAFIVAKMPALQNDTKSRVDWAGAITLILATVPFLLALQGKQGPAAGSPLRTWVMFGISLVSFVLFIGVERRNPDAILPLQLFRNRVFSIVLAMGASLSAALLAVIMFLSLFSVEVLGATARQAGAALMPLTAAVVVSSVISALVLGKTRRTKLVMVASMLIVCAALFALSSLSPQSTLFGIGVCVFAFGCGVGPIMPLLTASIQNAVAPNQVGIATASLQFFQQLGQSIGSAVFGVLFHATLSRATGDGAKPSPVAFAEAITYIYRWAFVLGIVSLLLALLLRESPLPKQGEEPIK